jgi:hypothetical protein
MGHLATGYFRSQEGSGSGLPRLGSCFRGKISLPMPNPRLFRCVVGRTDLRDRAPGLGVSELVLVCSRLHSEIPKSHERFG